MRNDCAENRKHQAEKLDGCQSKMLMNPAECGGGSNKLVAVSWRVGRSAGVTASGRSAGGGADLFRHVQVRLGHQETQASSSQTDQVHRAVTSRKQEDERERDGAGVQLLDAQHRQRG